MIKKTVMALGKLKGILKAGNSRHVEVLAGSYLGGHPLFPEEIKRSQLALDLHGIRVNKNPLVGRPEEIFVVALGEVESVRPEDRSYAARDQYVQQCMLSVSFYDKYGDLHVFNFLTPDVKGANTFLNKLKSNFYILKEHAANPIVEEERERIKSAPVEDAEPRPTPRRGPREL